jgi:hypothetical protein
VGEALRVPIPLVPRLSSLKPLELDIFQLVLNHGRLQHVFDQSPATDYETASALLRLLALDYLHRS